MRFFGLVLHLALVDVVLSHTSHIGIFWTMSAHSVASSRVGPDDASLCLGFPHQGPQRVPLVKAFHHLNVPRCRAWSCLLQADWKNFGSATPPGLLLMLRFSSFVHHYTQLHATRHNTQTHIFTHIYIHTYTYKYIHIYIHVYTCTHT